MATKKQSSPKPASESATKVTRISARDTDKPAPKPVATTDITTQGSPLSKIGTPFMAIGGYFAGAWYELKQVHWPNRKATWGMTLALLAFTAFFVVVILLLDGLFKYVFQLILG